MEPLVSAIAAGVLAGGAKSLDRAGPTITNAAVIAGHRKDRP